jgi:acetyl esterase/lipase
LTERDIEIPVRDGSSILAHVYAPSDVVPGDELPIFLFFHGGGFCLGTRHDDMESNRILTVKAGTIIVCLDYRLAPEHPFPQAIHDGVDALHWVSSYIYQLLFVKALTLDRSLKIRRNFTRQRPLQQALSSGALPPEQTLPTAWCI